MPRDSEDDKSPDKRKLIPVVLVVVAALAIAVAEVVKEQASNNWFVLLAALTVIVVQLSITYPQQAARLLRPIGDKIKDAPAMLAAGLGAALIVAAGTVAVMRLTGDDPCPHTTELRILTSPEGEQSIREVTQAYARATADDRCPAIFPYVYAADTAAVSGALARGWVDTRTEHPLINIGPRPDVWLPDSTVDVREVRDILARTLPPTLTVNGRLPPPLRSLTPIASSPIVLAGTTAPDDDTATLHELVGAVLEQRPMLAAADPESSAAGLLAATGYLLDERRGLVDPVEARRRERIIAASTPSRSDEVSMLCAYLRREDRPAVLTSLRTWQRMVTGRAMGAGCPAGPTRPEPGTVPLRAAEGPALDHPFVRFTWSSTRHARAADDLLTWLLSDNARPHLSGAGLDPPLPGCATLERNACVPLTLTAMLSAHRQAKLPGRVLLAVDASGSMAARAGPGTTTRFTIASQGVVEALGHLGPRDDFGLWTFPNPRGRRSPELVGLAPGSLPHRNAVVRELRTVRPTGATPLYATILAGLREVAGGDADERIRAVVVLTDGEDTTSDRSTRQVATEIRKLTGTSDVRLYVIATGDARCDDGGGTGTGLRRLTDAARGECVATSPGEADTTMAQLFGRLWGGR